MLCRLSRVAIRAWRFYLLVMFAGAFPKKWWFMKRLLSVRTEMSIIGGFVIFAHVIQVLHYGSVFLSLLIWDKAWGGGLTIRQSSCSLLRASWGCRLRCASLLPWITSFRTVRGIMGALDVGKVQRLRADPFMALMVLQGIFAFDWPCRICATWWRWVRGCYVVNASACTRRLAPPTVALKLRRRAERRAKVEARQDVPA